MKKETCTDILSAANTIFNLVVADVNNGLNYRGDRTHVDSILYAVTRPRVVIDTDSHTGHLRVNLEAKLHVSISEKDEG